jgi:hypothetical protein
MKRLFKRSATVLLVLVLIFSMTAMSVSAFTPPGQLRKAERVGELEQQQHQWRIFNEEGLAQFFRLMPEGIRGKFIPPGLLDKGGLPPGIQQVFGTNPENWPPGIRMRFADAVEWDEEDRDDQSSWLTRDVENFNELKSALESTYVRNIILMDDIIVEDTLVINRKVTIESEDDEKWMLEADEDFEGWMIEVRSTGHLIMYNVVLDGSASDEDDFEGFVKVAKGGKLEVDDNEFNSAPIGIAFWLDVVLDDLDADEREELLEELEEKADDLEDNNEFDDVDEPVVYYDEDDDMIYPEE